MAPALENTCQKNKASKGGLCIVFPSARNTYVVEQEPQTVWTERLGLKNEQPAGRAVLIHVGPLGGRRG